MKHMKVFLWVLLGALVALSQPVQAQSREEKRAQKAAAVAQAIESRHFVVDVDYMLPQQGQSHALTSPYSVEVRGDSLISYLPYVGWAYNVPYGGGKGLHFEAPIVSYKRRDDKKGRTMVHLDVRTDEGRYTYRFTFYPNGKASLHVSSAERQPISFQGEIDVEPQA